MGATWCNHDSCIFYNILITISWDKVPVMGFTHFHCKAPTNRLVANDSPGFSRKKHISTGQNYRLICVVGHGLDIRLYFMITWLIKKKSLIKLGLPYSTLYIATRTHQRRCNNSWICSKNLPRWKITASWCDPSRRTCPYWRVARTPDTTWDTPNYIVQKQQVGAWYGQPNRISWPLTYNQIFFTPLKIHVSLVDVDTPIKIAKAHAKLPNQGVRSGTDWRQRELLRLR